MAYNIANAAAKVVNLAGGTVAAGIDIEGGYFPIDSLSNIPDHAKVLGALCYVTGTAEKPINKFYQYNGTNWVEKEFGTKVEASDTNGKIKLDGVDTTVYTHPEHTAKDKALYKVEVNGEGHVSDADPVVKKDITDLGIPGQDTTYDLDTSKNSGNGDVKINLTSSDTSSQPDSIIIQGSGATTVTTDANGVITISSTDTQDGNDNQTIKTETVEFGANDPVTIKAGNNVTVEGDATNKTITVSATDTTYDIIDDLTTEDSTNPLSAKQGVVIKALIDALQGNFDKIIPTFVGTTDQYTEKKAEIPEGALVIITDDETGSATSSKLGEGVLGYMILG